MSLNLPRAIRKWYECYMNYNKTVRFTLFSVILCAKMRICCECGWKPATVSVPCHCGRDLLLRISFCTLFGWSELNDYELIEVNVGKVVCFICIVNNFSKIHFVPKKNVTNMSVASALKDRIFTGVESVEWHLFYSNALSQICRFLLFCW